MRNLLYDFGQYQFEARRWSGLETDVEPADREDVFEGKDNISSGRATTREVDLRPSDNVSHSPGAPNFENMKSSPTPIADRPDISVPTCTTTYRDGQGSGGHRAHQTFEYAPSQTDPPSHSHSSSPTGKLPTNSARKFVCATQFRSGITRAANKARASQIALNCDGDAIYRFAPSVDRPITVSIDQKSFIDHNIQKSLVRQLHHGLQFTIESLNNLRLGIMFELTHCAGRGMIEVKYGGEGIFRDNPGEQTWKLWAETRFPQPKIEKYTIFVYASTFEPEYHSSIPNILSHEFGHLLSMRHWDAEAKESFLPSIQYPAGDYDDQSIMGRFDHPGDLRYRMKDVQWLQNFYRLKEGEEIGSKTVKNINY